MNDSELRLECLRIVVGLGTSQGVDPRPAAERLYRFVKFGDHEDKPIYNGHAEECADIARSLFRSNAA
jgi:hypothetical protein